MKLILQCTFLVIIFLFTSSVFALPELSKAFIYNQNPVIVFSELIHDFGKVPQGPVLEYSFKFKNEGSERLIITGVYASCGCTGAVIDGKKEFEEGESGEIKVSFNTQGREGFQSKTVTVQSNDPTHPQIILSFKCEIYRNQ